MDKPIGTSANLLHKEQQSLGIPSNNEFGFDDFIDVLNPLQHLPIVSSIYREHTQDEISEPAKAVGDVLYGVLTGGVVGFAGALGNQVLRQQTNQDIGEHLWEIANNGFEPTAQPNIAQVDDGTINGKTLEQVSASEQNYGPLMGDDIAGLAHYQEPSQSQKLAQNSNVEEQWALRMKQIFGENTG